MSRAPSVACTGCSRTMTPLEPRIVVRYQRTTYDSGGRVLDRYCEKCWPAARPRDQRHTRTAATR